ncbi:ATP-binding cassette domain-containing protein [Rhodobacterales bacterium HKCCSP123]|nr:ATP-binding cassette domain-containing protein [Rhodobacterales bacterium HKCCSP123]
MSDVVIRAEGLGKKYLIGHEAEHGGDVTLRDTIMRGVSRMKRSAGDLVRGRPLIVGDEVEEFWALRDVNFEIRRGDVVGIIGRNGAGKSTLLKVLSRITEPTEGRVTIEGRVASLLEVGTGFHPELSGRENIFLNGSILGMTRKEIQSKFDEIVDFAGVEKFIDTPVKRYSSGMKVRLGFSVAAHLEPEILIVDEVLAVGDAEFQKKCLGKMQDVAGDGRTVLFVSHNANAIRRLCDSAILLDSGKVKDKGEVEKIFSVYEARKLSHLWHNESNTEIKRYGSHPDLFRSIEVKGFNTTHGEVVRRGYPLTFFIQIDSPPEIKLQLSAVITTPDGLNVAQLSQYDDPMFANEFDVRKNSVVLTINPLPFQAGVYSVNFGLHDLSMHPIDVLIGAVTIIVEDDPKSARPFVSDGSNGFVAIPATWALLPKGLRA